MVRIAPEISVPQVDVKQIKKQVSKTVFKSQDDIINTLIHYKTPDLCYNHR